MDSSTNKRDTTSLLERLVQTDGPTSRPTRSQTRSTAHTVRRLTCTRMDSDRDLSAHTLSQRERDQISSYGQTQLSSASSEPVARQPVSSSKEDPVDTAVTLL